MCIRDSLYLVTIILYTILEKKDLRTRKFMETNEMQIFLQAREDARDEIKDVYKRQGLLLLNQILKKKKNLPVSYLAYILIWTEHFAYEMQRAKKWVLQL